MVGGGWEKKTPSEERVHQSLSLTAFGVDCGVALTNITEIAAIGWIGKFSDSNPWKTASSIELLFQNFH